MHRLTSLFFSLLLLFSLTACSTSEPSAVSTPPTQTTDAVPDAAVPQPEGEPTPEPEPEPYEILDPTVMPEGGLKDGVPYAAYNGVVEPEIRAIEANYGTGRVVK